MNLAVIPDSVVKKIDFHPGWQSRFKENMQAFKTSFDQQKEKGGKWKYQDRQLEKQYTKFVSDKEDELRKVSIISRKITSKMNKKIEAAFLTSRGTGLSATAK